MTGAICSLGTPSFQEHDSGGKIQMIVSSNLIKTNLAYVKEIGVVMF